MFLYVIEFSDGVVKVGETSNFQKRLASHKSENEKIALRTVFRSFCAECFELKERDLILFCNKNYTLYSGNEYFKNADYDEICKIIDSDSKDLASPHFIFISDDFKVSFDKEANLLNANQILNYGNKKRLNNGKSKKQLSQYFENDDTKNLITQIKWEFTLLDSQIKKVSKGRSGETWLHPILALDLALWLDKTTLIKLSKLVLNSQLERLKCDSFLEMTDKLRVVYKDDLENPNMLIKIDNSISKACGIYSNRIERWQYATNEQLKMRDEIQRLITIYADVVPSIIDCVNKAINKVLEKYKPMQNLLPEK